MVDRGSRHPRELLSSRIDGEIEPSEARFLQTHVERCAECQRKDAELKKVAEGLARLTAPDPDPQGLARLLARFRPLESQDAPAVPAVEAPAPAVGSVDEPAPQHSRRPVGWIAAAAIVLCGLIYLGLRPSGSDEPPAPIPSATAVREIEPRHSTPPPATAAEAMPAAIPAPIARVPDPAPPARPRPLPAVARVTPPPPPPRSEPEIAPARPAEPVSRALDPGPAHVEPPVDPAFPDLQFKKKSDRLNEDARRVVESAAAYLRDHPETTLWVEGHADGRASDEENLALAEQRARAVARHLTSLGAPAGRIRTRSHAAAREVASDADRAARKANNRVELVVRR